MIELMIFLTISGLLLVIAFIGAGNMARYARFSDSVNTFQSLVLKQYGEVLSGVNTRVENDGCGGSNDPGSGSCLLLGKVISWAPDTSEPQIKIWYVTTTNMAVQDIGDVYSQLAEASPTINIVDTTTEVSDLSWGASFQEASRSTAKVGVTDPVKTGSVPERALINSVAFLRGPNSSQIVPYYFYTSNYNDVATLTTSLRAATDAANYTKTSKGSSGVPVTAVLCIINKKDWVSGSPVAAVTFSQGSGAASIQTDFDPLRTGVTAICSL